MEPSGWSRSHAPGDCAAMKELLEGDGDCMIM